MVWCVRQRIARRSSDRPGLKQSFQAGLISLAALTMAAGGANPAVAALKGQAETISWLNSSVLFAGDVEAADDEWLAGLGRQQGSVSMADVPEISEAERARLQALGYEAH